MGARSGEAGGWTAAGTGQQARDLEARRDHCDHRHRCVDLSATGAPASVAVSPSRSPGTPANPSPTCGIATTIITVRPFVAARRRRRGWRRCSNPPAPRRRADLGERRRKVARGGRRGRRDVRAANGELRRPRSRRSPSTRSSPGLKRRTLDRQAGVEIVAGQRVDALPGSSKASETVISVNRKARPCARSSRRPLRVVLGDGVEAEPHRRCVEAAIEAFDRRRAVSRRAGSGWRRRAGRRRWRGWPIRWAASACGPRRTSQRNDHESPSEMSTLVRLQAPRRRRRASQERGEIGGIVVEIRAAEGVPCRRPAR